MDACRDIQRSDTDEIRARMKEGIHKSNIIFKMGADHFEEFQIEN